MKKPFTDFFRENPDGSLTPKMAIKIGNAIIGPSITFRKGLSISGFDIFQLKGHDLAVESGGSFEELTGYYN